MSDLSLRPCFPAVLPRSVDPLWHRVDEARDENAELTRLEREQEIRKKSIAKSYSDIPPIGKTSQEPLEDDDEDEDDDNDDQDDDNDSDSHEEEEEDVEMDMNFQSGDSPATGGAAGGGAGQEPATPTQEDIEGTLNTLAAGMTPPLPPEHPSVYPRDYEQDAAAAAAAAAEEEAEDEEEEEGGSGGTGTAANNDDSTTSNPPPESLNNSEENE